MVCLLLATGAACTRCLYRPVGLQSAGRVARTRALGHRDLASSRRKGTTMTETQLVISADGHILEPTDLFTTRLPKSLRDRGVWEDDFEIEPLVEGGATKFRRLHTPGFEGWSISRYRQTGGRMPEGDPAIIIGDLSDDGVDEIERAAALGFRAILLPATPPLPYYSRDLDPVWAAAQASGLHVFF